jgi:hypothetical protein
VVNTSRRVVHVRIGPLRVGAAAAGVALTLAACSATNPATIATPFDPADGRNAQIGGEPGNGGGEGNYQGNGGIKLRDFLVVSQGNNSPGVVVGAISNDTDRNAQLALTVGSTDASGQTTELGSTTISLPPGGFIQLGSPAAASAGATSAGATSPGATSATASAGATTGPTSSSVPTAGSSGASPGSGTAASASQSAGTSSALGVEPAPGQVVWFQVKAVGPPAGAFLRLVARDPALGSASLDLPILPPVDEYASVTPTSAAPSGSAGTGPTGSPQPTANPSGAAHQPTPSTSGSSSS